MSFWSSLALGVVVVTAAGAALGYGSYRRAMADAESAYASLRTSVVPETERYDPRMVAQLPEVAQRYFNHAIKPGTPLRSAVELEMEGTFLLGDRDRYQTYRMTARQMLRPPGQFVWLPTLRSGFMHIGGSDALVGSEAWTRFWLFGIVPVAQSRTSPDFVQSAEFRAAVEGALWLPSSLLPANGVHWEQIGPDSARVTFRKAGPPILLILTLGRNGEVRQVVGQRWSNANPQKIFRLQPFGGTITAEGVFDGYRIPTDISVGNHYGTDHYLPFFQAKIIRATYRD